jgi:hypothetical protein
MENLSLSLTNKGKPGGFSLSNINSSKLTTNTFGTQGFKANTKNTSNVNSKEVHKVTKADKKEQPASGEEKPPAHDEVFPSSPSPQGGYDVTDLLGRRHTIKPGVTSDEALDTILGKHWLSKDLWNVGEGIVQGLAIEATGGASQLIIGGRAWMSIKTARRALIGVKAGVSSARYYLDPSQSHGDPNGLFYSMGLGIGGQFKFGNLYDGLDGLVSHNSSLYKIAHTAHDWHYWSGKNRISAGYYGPIQIGNRYDFTKGISLKNFSDLSKFKQGTSLTVDNLFFSFGADNLEKQWFTATNLYKGKAFKSPYQYKMEKYGAHYGEKDDYYGKINSKLDSELEDIEVSAGKFGTAYDRYVSRENEYKAEGMNFLGNAVSEQRNKGQFLKEVMDENHVHIQTDNWLLKEQILNGNLYEKTLGIISLPGQTAANLLVGAENIGYAARGFVNSAVETVVTPFGELAYDAWMYAMVKLTVKDPATTTKVKKQEKKANGTTTLFIKSDSYQAKMNQQVRDAEIYSGTYKTNEAARMKKTLTLSKEQMDKIAANKKLYDNRAALQKELNALKKEHEKGWIFTKPWTDAELDRAKYLTGWIKTYNEFIQIAEGGGRTTPSKVSVETPKNKH